jgi:hypothetical protein
MFLPYSSLLLQMDMTCIKKLVRTIIATLPFGTQLTLTTCAANAPFFASLSTGSGAFAKVYRGKVKGKEVCMAWATTL